MSGCGGTRTQGSCRLWGAHLEHGKLFGETWGELHQYFAKQIIGVGGGFTRLYLLKSSCAVEFLHMEVAFIYGEIERAVGSPTALYRMLDQLFPESSPAPFGVDADVIEVHGGLGDRVFETTAIDSYELLLDSQGGHIGRLTQFLDEVGGRAFLAYFMPQLTLHAGAGLLGPVLSLLLLEEKVLIVDFIGQKALVVQLGDLLHDLRGG